jgi:hypothetical protein
VPRLSPACPLTSPPAIKVIPTADDYNQRHPPSRTIIYRQPPSFSSCDSGSG